MDMHELYHTYAHKWLDELAAYHTLTRANYLALKTPRSNTLLRHRALLGLIAIELPPSLLESSHLLWISQQLPLMSSARDLSAFLHGRPLKHPLFPLRQSWKFTQLHACPST